MAKKRTSFVFHHSYKDTFESINKELAFDLICAMVDFSESGIVPAPTADNFELVCAFHEVLPRLRSDITKYQEESERKRDNAIEQWEQRKQAGKTKQQEQPTKRTRKAKNSRKAAEQPNTHTTTIQQQEDTETEDLPKVWLVDVEEVQVYIDNYSQIVSLIPVTDSSANYDLWAVYIAIDRYNNKLQKAGYYKTYKTLLDNGATEMIMQMLQKIGVKDNTIEL